MFIFTLKSCTNKLTSLKVDFIYCWKNCQVEGNNYQVERKTKQTQNNKKLKEFFTLIVKKIYKYKTNSQIWMLNKYLFSKVRQNLSNQYWHSNLKDIKLYLLMCSVKNMLLSNF